MSVQSSDSSTTTGGVTGVLRTILSSVPLSIGVMGILFIVVGYLVQVLIVAPSPENTGAVWAAIFPIWGVGLMVAGFGIYALVWWSRQ